MIRWVIRSVLLIGLPAKARPSLIVLSYVKYSVIDRDHFLRLLRSILRWTFLAIDSEPNCFSRFFHSSKEVCKLTTRLRISRLIEDMIQLSRSWSWRFHAAFKTIATNWREYLLFPDRVICAIKFDWCGEGKWCSRRDMCWRIRPWRSHNLWTKWL